LSGRTAHAFLRRLADTGYECHIFYRWLSSVELAVARVRRRVQAGGHNVPEPVIRRRFGKSLINFDRLYRPAATTWRLYDGGAPVGMRLIAHGTDRSQEIVVDAEGWALVSRQIEKEDQ
jgi:predicted ABC-type ATPase